MPESVEHVSRCANYGEPLAGEYCSRCGQRAIDYHRLALFSVVPVINGVALLQF